MVKVTETKEDKLNSLISKIDTNFGKGSIMRLGDKSNMEIERFSTGALNLDIALGGGLPRGRIIEIWGAESSGKSSLTLHAIAEVQKAGGMAAVVDTEHSLDPIYAAALGVNTDELLVSQPSTAEEALEVVDQLISSGIVQLVVVDSVAALVPRAELEGEIGDAHMALQARLMSQTLRKITGKANETGTTVFFTNQTRCIPEDFSVFSESGVTKIEALKPGDKILASYGYYVSVVATTEPTLMDTVKFQVKKRQSFECSLNHIQPVIPKNGSYVIQNKIGSEVESGDFLIYPQLSTPEFRLNDRSCEIAVNTVNLNLYHNTKSYQLPTQYSEKLALLAGMFYADGSYVFNPDKADYRVQIAEKNQIRHELVYNLCVDIFGQDLVRENSAAILMGGKQILDYFIQALGLRRYGEFKVIPDWVKSDIDFLRQFLRGSSFDTHFCGNNKSKSYFCWTVENQNDASSFMSALSLFGVSADYSTRNGTCYLFISGDDAIRFYENVGFMEPQKNEYASRIQPTANARGKYDVIPYGLALTLKKEAKTVYKGKALSLAPYGDALAQCIHKKLNVSRVGMISYLEYVDKEYFADVIHFLGANRFAEVEKVETSTNRCIDIEVDSADSLFIANNVLTHNSKIGVTYGSTEALPGGNALKFYASIRMKISRIQTLKKGTDEYGIRSKVRVMKNKTAVPFKEVEFDILFGQGISTMGCLVDLAEEKGIIVRKAAWYSYEGTSMGCGRDKAMEWLKENPAIAANIESQIKTSLSMAKNEEPVVIEEVVA